MSKGGNGGKASSAEDLQNPVCKYSILAYTKDPIFHALVFHILSASVALGLVVHFFERLSLSLCLDWRCWIGVVMFGTVWFKVVRLLCNGHFLKNNVSHKRDLKGKTLVITGASGGIGKQCSCEVVSCGGNVVMGCRDVSKGVVAKKDVCRFLDGGSRSQWVELLPLDLENEDSIRKFANRIISRNIHVDVLVNNAGVMMPPKLKFAKTGVETQMASNHLGHFLLTSLLLENIKKNSGRIINVSSMAHCCVPDIYRARRKGKGRWEETRGGRRMV